MIIEFGIFTVFRLRQPEKAELPMVNTEFGISMEGKILQFLKACLPILITELGINTDVTSQ